jgi:hypothetical protein
LIGLIDVDSKIPNLALMKLSSYYKSLGEEVEFVQPNKQYEKIFASAIFTRSKDICSKLQEQYGDKIEIGGTGWDIKKELDPVIEHMKPDYELYTAEMIAARMRGIMTKQRKFEKATEIVNAGIGFTSRGCIRNCKFCFVPKKEGCFRQTAEIKDLINPKSNILILNDNNLTADPNCIEKLHEIRDRGLVVDINQGCDVRLMTPDIAKALSEVKHLRSIHYAWDLMGYENQVLDGIKELLKYMKAWRHMCFMLVGFNTSFEEDMYRFKKLDEMGIRPYVMVYNEKKDIRLKHFERWVNSCIYKACTWEEYEPWIRDQVLANQISFEI